MGRRLVGARSGALGWLTGVVLLTPMVSTAPEASAATGSYLEPGSISIEDRNFNKKSTGSVSVPGSGEATPYPSTVAISGVAGTIVDLDLQLELTHPHPHGMDLLLVGPGGQQAVVMSDAGATDLTPAALTLTLDDEAESALPNSTGALVTGDYRPANHEPGDTFPAPATASTAGSALSVFDGIDPNGTWSLYVVGDGAAAGGTLTRWTLDFDTNHVSDPYPSTISVSGLPVGILDVDVTLHSFDHQQVSDVDVMLVGPGGQRAILMSNTGAPPPGGQVAATDLTLTFDDQAATKLPKTGSYGAGTYFPSDYGFSDDDFPAPAPDRVGAQTLSVFNETNPNGTWRLFVLDTHHDYQGDVSGGWSLQINTTDAPATPAITSPAGESIDRDGAVDFAGTAPAGSTVRVLEGGAQRGVTAASATGAWAMVLAGVPDGTHTYHAVASDSFGNTSGSSAPVTVVVDQTDPVGSVKIDGDASRTGRTSVTLSVSASDPAPGSGVTQMRFSNDAVTWSGFEPYAASKGWSLPGADGTKTVYAQFADRAGNLSVAASDTIVLDTSGSGPGPGTSATDTSSPRVTSTKPAHRATGTKRSADVRAVFSERMSAASINRLSVRLLAPDGSRVKARISYDNASRAVTIDPRTKLARATTYRVVISSVRDLAGNVLDQKPKAGTQPKRWRFTTR